VTTRTLTAGLAPFEAHAGVWDLLAPGATERAAEAEDLARTPVDWDALMKRHGRRVVVSLIGQGIPVDRANDLAQDAWLKIIAQYRAGRLPELKMPGLVIAQATYLARDDRRRTQRRGTVETTGAAEAADTRVLERRVAARQELRRVLEIVASSYPNARRVFTLAYGSKAKTAPEIADELGISCQRVRQILCELRRQMRDELGGAR
jgi:RNA polymerase sigma-70 factor (ECF subfamily)